MAMMMAYDGDEGNDEVGNDGNEISNEGKTHQLQ